MQTMTDYFMLYLKNYKRAWLISFALLCILFAGVSVAANTSSIHIKSAEITQAEENYVLIAELDYTFGSQIEEALNKGVPLNFIVEFQLSSPRKYWFDDEIFSQSEHVIISYYALSRQYLVNRSGRQESYPTLQAAKESLEKIRQVLMLDKHLLKKGDNYQAAIRVRLDQKKLPKPLQIEASGSDDWTMLSERYRWVPNLNL
jgi:Domain of unknown function (DUF4390)